MNPMSKARNWRDVKAGALASGLIDEREVAKRRKELEDRIAAEPDTGWTCKCGRHNGLKGDWCFSCGGMWPYSAIDSDAIANEYPDDFDRADEWRHCVDCGDLIESCRCGE